MREQEGILVESADGGHPYGSKSGNWRIRKICTGCKGLVEMLHHLFVDCPCVLNSSIRLCGWVSKVWGVKISRMQLIVSES